MKPGTVVALTKHIVAQFDCQCRFLHAHPVVHTENGRIRWQGSVGTFAIRRGTESDICYAWLDGAARGASSPITVLKTWSIQAPATAVAWHLRQQAADSQLCPM